MYNWTLLRIVPRGRPWGLGDAYRDGVVTSVAVVLGSVTKVNGAFGQAADGAFVQAIVKAGEGIVGSMADEAVEDPMVAKATIVHSEGTLRRLRLDRLRRSALGTMVDLIEPR